MATGRLSPGTEEALKFIIEDVEQYRVDLKPPTTYKKISRHLAAKRALIHFTGSGPAASPASNQDVN